MNKKITINNVHVGTRFREPELAYPHNQIMIVIGFERNKDAGEPIRDEFGGVCWKKPLGSIVAKGEVTGEVKKYSVQSENSNLSRWLTFLE